MELIPYLSLLISPFVAGSSATLVSTFYDDTYTLDYNCSVHFDQPMLFDCACITGLWILYESCFEKVIVAGDDITRCVQLTGTPIAKAIQVVKNRNELAVVTPMGQVALLEPESFTHLRIFNDWALITGSDWTVIDDIGTRICLSVIEPDSYCFFAFTESFKLDIEGVVEGCDDFDYFMDPQKCEPISGEYENICEFQSSKHKLVKRQADADPPAAAASGNSSDAITEEDEDYLIVQANANKTSENVTDPTLVVADAILDYIDTVLDDLLGLHENHLMTTNDVKSSGAASTIRTTVPDSTSRVKKGASAPNFMQYEDEYTTFANLNPLNITYSNPVYEFLEISKRITQITCPSFYVNPRFLNLAVATFIRLQQVQFKFPETSFKPAGFRRVLRYMRNCEQYASQFNFTDADCDGQVAGNYTVFSQTFELTVTSDHANFNRDPIIESVWKVFFNAHSYCYPFFNKTLDHHRFTTWMIPLFQNQINDVWIAGKTTEKSLNGLFGNQIKVQGNLAYCAASSRLDSTYPFDLPRPVRVPDYGPSLLNSSAAATGRRKRDADFFNYLTPNRFGNCLDASKPMLCSDHVKSIVSQ